MRTGRLKLLVALVLLVAPAAGCNMIKGFGMDVHDSAQNIQGWFEDSVEAETQS